nr:MAG TPA: hypothetical protein [Caudoviricetes sp.]
MDLMAIGQPRIKSVVIYIKGGITVVIVGIFTMIFVIIINLRGEP